MKLWLTISGAASASNSRLPPAAPERTDVGAETSSGATVPSMVSAGCTGLLSFREAKLYTYMIRTPPRRFGLSRVKFGKIAAMQANFHEPCGRCSGTTTSRT